MASKGTPVSKKEEKEILEALESGLSLRKVAKKFSRSSSTISEIAKRNGFDIAEHARSKKNAVAASCYASEERIRLIGEAMNKGRELLKKCDNARDFQYLMTGLAIGIDKRRLEGGPDASDKPGEIKKLFDTMEEEAKDEHVSDSSRTSA